MKMINEKKIKKEMEQLGKYLDIETNLGRGANTLDLSPYSAVIQTIINQNINKIKEFIR